MLTAEAAFSLFLMLALSSAVYALAQRFRLPYTVLLTLLGVLLVFVSSIPALAFLREFHLTPELLFYIFLPTLLFESAFNMSIRRVVDEFKPIMLLAVGGYLVSALSIGAVLWFCLSLFGFEIPFLVTLLFGALISATDPVAVLALFKEYGAPRRLTLIFEGESLANDATALAFFLVALGFIEHGLTSGSIALGAVTFFSSLIGGAIIGLLMGTAFVRAISFFRENEMVATTLMIVLAHMTFLVAELGTHVLGHVGVEALKFSPIIATTVAALMMGNYGRFKVSPRADEFVEKLWAQFAFMANSVVFILVGFLFASVPHGARDLWIPILVAVVVVMFSRAVSIYGTLMPFNFLRRAEQVPWTWQHLLAWGSLRGALSVMLVLMVPADLAVPGWPLDISVQNFLLVLTVSCIFVTLFIKAPTVGPLMRLLKVDTLSHDEEVAEREARGIVHGRIQAALEKFGEKGYIPAGLAASMRARHMEGFRKYALSVQSSSGESRTAAERVLQLYIIGIEKEVLKDLYVFGEVTERVFKHIWGKLTLQAEAIEAGLSPDPHKARDWRDVFENLADFVHSLFGAPSREELAEDQILYYRAQHILANKIIQELETFDRDFADTMFAQDSLDRIYAIYKRYRDEAQKKRDDLRAAYPAISAGLDARLAGKSVFRVEEKELNKLHRREFLTSKLYIKLKKESGLE